MHVLVINCGSSSVKYQVVNAKSGKALMSGIKERIDNDEAYDRALAEILAEAKTHDIGAVGHRVVHGGPHFAQATAINDDVIAAIEACVPLAPLHNPPNLRGIRAAQKLLPDVTHVAVFDTAFHATMPRRAKTYALDRGIAQTHNIRRYGFHGTSHAFVAAKAADYLGEDIRNLRIITLHLGNGCSACAVEYGRSVETSMGLTPLEGLVMGTRSGDIDAGVVLLLAEQLGIDKTSTLLNRKSGMLGISGVSSDLRDLQSAAEEGVDGARLAINVFAHQARKYIGAYAAAMGGVDAIVLTGGIGENAAAMRQRILQRLEFLGIRIDEDKNLDCKVTDNAPVFDIGDGRVRTLVVATNEEWQIARETATIAEDAGVSVDKKPIPIAVSARHIHLTREALDTLYGKDYELTPYKPLSQPGQFAAEEKLTVIGPRNSIEGVRILGPLRPACQVEISRTDEFFLGVDAPVRASGKVTGSAPITLEGPNGKLHLDEGLICAWRHIHMTTADAEYYGVAHGDQVEVSISGGDRDLTFGDVMVRVKDSYKLEMHIDTDEANAAELGRTAEGALVYDDVYVESTTASATIESVH